MIRKPEMTEKNLAAHQLNSRKSRGPATPGGKARSALMAPKDENALLMQRMEDSNFRQVARVTSLLMRMRRQERQMEALENIAVLHDVPETKGVSDGDPKPCESLCHLN
ncbi:MAG: hypothetical protein LAO04_09160 [Acidobacteriia bacterium]|nr:hypothetical protein [Terriglobia bacterium]